VYANRRTRIDLVFGAAQGCADACNVAKPELTPALWTRDDGGAGAKAPEAQGTCRPLYDPPRVRCVDGKWGRAEAGGGRFAAVVGGDAGAARFVCTGDAGMCGVTIGRDGTVKTAVIGDAPEVGGGLLIVGKDGLIVWGEREESCAVPPEKVVACAATETEAVLLGASGAVWPACIRDLAASERRCAVFDEQPSAIAVGAECDVLAIATADGLLILYRLSEGRFRVRTALEKEVPSRVLVIEGWRFVLVGSEGQFG
jgi:hypothetical protein